MAFVPFNDEQARLIVNLRQHYDGWMDARRALDALPYGMKIREVNGQRYLFESHDRNGNGKTLGRMDEERQKTFDTYHQTKSALKDRLSGSRTRLTETAALYRALRLPMLPNNAVDILYEADRRNLLGSHLMIVGTNALPAYQLEAVGFIRDAPEQTDDFDIAWTKSEVENGFRPFWNVLTAADSSYAVNDERPFQASNQDAYEVEILVAPSRAAGMFRTDQPRPISFPEQEWLLLGRMVDQVVIGRNGAPARLVVPDPRYFGLHKLWMAKKLERHPAKKPKDEKQGMALLDAVADHMAHFPMNEEFIDGLPDPLRPHYDRWKSQWEPSPHRW